MTIKFLTTHGKYKLNDIDTLTAAEESALIALKVATSDTSGGSQYFPQEEPCELNRARQSRTRDNGNDPLKSTSATAITYTLFSNITLATRLRQDGAGIVTVTGDASVKMYGAGGGIITSLATSGLGSMILIEPKNLNVTPAEYYVIKGGA